MQRETKTGRRRSNSKIMLKEKTDAVWEILKGVSFCYECIGLINSVQKTPSTSASVLSIEVASRVVISFPRSNLVSRLLFVLAKIAALLRVAGVTAALAQSNGSLPPGL